MHLVLFRAEGNHRLPPTTLSPGDMVCVRTCDSRGAGATSCMQGFVNNLGEDGCSISVALESRYGDSTFSKLFGKNIRIDRIHGLADAVTYEVLAIETSHHFGLVLVKVFFPLLNLETRPTSGPQVGQSCSMVYTLINEYYSISHMLVSMLSHFF